MQSGSFHRCKCSDTRLLSVVWHSSTEEQGRQFTLSSALVFGDCKSAEWIFICVNAVHKAAVSWFGTAAQKNKAGSSP